MAESNSVYTRRDGVVAQKASEQLVLLDVEGGQYYSLNEVGARVWELSDGSRTLKDIVTVVSEEFDAPPETVSSDVHELVDDLVGEELLTNNAS